MTKPCFIIHTASGDKDWTWILNEKSIKWTRNDIDAANSGRNTLDARMRRHRVAIKDKWEFSDLRALTQAQIVELNADLGAEYVDATLLSPRQGVVRKTYYGSSVDAATAVYSEAHGDTMWEGISFNLIEV